MKTIPAITAFCIALAATPAGAQTTIFAATNKGIYRSADSGSTWETAMTEVDAAALAASQFHKRVIYAATSAGVYRSNDGGQTWLLQSRRGGTKIAVDARDPDLVYLLSNKELWRSTDGGQEWSKANVPLARGVVADQLRPGLVYANTLTRTSPGPHVSEDGGVTWRLAGRAPSWLPEDFAAHPARAGSVYGFDPGDGAVVASQDAGVSWSVSGGLYGAILDYVGGTNWDAGGYQTSAFLADPVRPGDLHACFVAYYERVSSGRWEEWEGGVIGSRVDGVWKVMPLPEGASYCLSLARPLDGEGWLYAGTGFGLFRRKGPGNWEKADATMAMQIHGLLTINRQETPRIDTVSNAASFDANGVVAGSLATIFGANLSGKNVAVAFDGVPARIVSQGEMQINVVVPAEPAGRADAEVWVVVDNLSAAANVKLAPAWPAIFPGGVLNWDGTVNSASNPAAPGSVLQLIATGLPLGDGWAATAHIHDRDFLVPSFMGPAPEAPGAQGVGILIPADLPEMTAGVRICATHRSDPERRICGPSAPVALGR